MTLLIGSFTIGLILAILALGIFISFKIFNSADITAEGSVTFGAAIAAALIVAGVSPLLATLIAFLGGMAAGAVTGILQTKFKINSLLAGILVMTALYSVNLHVMGKSNVPLLTETSLITYFEKMLGSIFRMPAELNIAGWMVPSKDISALVCIFTIVLITGILLYLFFKTNIGTAMRATGNNAQMIRALGVSTNGMIVFGLALSNGLIALSGALLAQYQGFADVQMGIGMLVWGLASVIIGEALLNDKSLGFLITGTIMGSVVFRLLVAIALRWGMNPNDLKLITALFVFIALTLPYILGKIKMKKAKAQTSLK
ncbi:MAG TPA: ABC transporter permease [Bacteroidales bacterium]|nr:ABC transporter permease [Bacteroidales bacterium]